MPEISILSLLSFGILALGIFVKRMCRVGIMADNVFHEKDNFKFPYLQLQDHSLRYIVPSVVSHNVLSSWFISTLKIAQVG